MIFRTQGDIKTVCVCQGLFRDPCTQVSCLKWVCSKWELIALAYGVHSVVVIHIVFVIGWYGFSNWVDGMRWAPSKHYTAFYWHYKLPLAADDDDQVGGKGIHQKLIAARTFEQVFIFGASFFLGSRNPAAEERGVLMNKGRLFARFSLKVQSYSVMYVLIIHQRSFKKL